MEEELLKEYVATYLNPKYNSNWDVVNSKFPELSGVDKELLKEYVATYLNPKYNGDWNIVNSKFPELNISTQPSTILKKKEDTTALPLEVGSSASSVSAEPKPEVDPEAIRFGELASKINQPEAKRVDEEGYIDPRSMLGMYPTKEQADKATTQAMADIDATKGERKQPAKGGGKGYVENLFTNVGLGAAYFNEGIASIPESAINLLAIPQNFVAEKTGWDIGVTADGIKESWGITNPLLDYVQEDKKILNGEVSKFIAERYEDPSVVGNFQKGNYKEGFELLGSAIAQSLPTSIALMVGGAKMTPAQLTALSTIIFTEGQRQELAEMDPTMPEAEKTFKALSMAAMEGVFSSIGTGTIGKAYKNILAKEGPEAAPKILKDGLVAAYTKALEKTGPVAGFLGNSLEETGVQISQNVVAGRPAFEGAADAFVIGGGQGVVFTAPIGAINAKRYVQGKVESYQTKDKIGKILGDKSDDIDKLYNVPVASEITTQQLEISNLPKSREILVNRLKKGVADSKITEDDAKQSLFVFDKIQQVSNAVKDLDIPVEDKAKVATLLTQRDDIKTKIQNKDDVLVVQEKKKIEDINIQIQEILSKPKQEAPSYKVGGIDVTTDVIDNLLKTKSKEELLAMNIEIINDPEGRVEKFQSIINPETAAVEQKEAVVESGLTPEERVQRIEEIEIDLKFDNRMIREGRTTLGEKRYDLEDELQTLKAEEDAFQKQAAGQVPVQSGTTVSQEVAQGEPQAEPQVTAQEGQAQEEVGSGVFDLKEIGKNIKQDDLIRFQELSESLREGELLLKDNVDASGNKLTAEKRLQIEKSIESTKRKIQSLSLQEGKVQEEVPIIESAKNSLGKRLSGDQLLNSQDLIDELNDNKAEIDEEGMVTVYHRTTPENKVEIERTGEMQGLEDGVFFSTTETGQNQGYGDAVVKLKIPVEQLIVDDTFGDEAHLRIPTAKAGQVLNVKEYIQSETKATGAFADELSAKYGVELELQDNKTDNSISVPKIVVPKDQRNTGVGTKVMEEVVEFADKSGKKLVLTPSTSFGGTSVKRLVDFYKGLGFVENKGKNKDFTIRDSMYRNPVPVAQEAAPVPPAVSPSVSPAPVAEEVSPESAKKETFEELMERSRKEGEAIEAETKDFNSKNEREYTGRKDKGIIQDDIIQAENDVFSAQRRIGSASNVEAAINEYNKAKEKVSELQEEINQLDDFNDVNNLISEEIESSKRPDYEHKKLFKKDPRLASIKSYNDTIDFLKTIEGKEDSISRYERFIKILEEDIKKYPIKEQVAKAKKAPKKTVPKKDKRDEIISRPAFTPVTLARQWLLLGGKLLPKQSEENKRRGVGAGKGVQEETGMSGVEMRALGDVTDSKKGISIETAAGKIWEGLSPEIQVSMDDMDIRDAMIEILRSENRKSWIENQDRETSEDDQNSAREDFEYAQLTEQERADFDEYQQRESYNNYLNENAKRLAKAYDAYIKSKTYQDYIEETYERDREGQNNAKNQNDGRGKKQGSDGGKDSVKIREKAAEAPEVKDKLDELLKLDPEDKGTGKKALDYLDGLIKDYDDIEKEGLNLGIALSSIKGILKGIRALVQAGITLSDAIKQIARENNVSVKDITDGINTINQIIPIQAGFNNLMDKADALIARQKAKGVEEKKIISNLDAMVRKDRAYIDGTDAQRKIMESEARAKMGVEPRKAASIGRVVGVLKDIANVTREEKLKIIGRIRELGRDVAKDLTSEIRQLANGGTITVNQAADIIARFGKVNMLNEKSVSNFVDYMAKVFANAEYNSQLKSAVSTRKRLRSLSKNKDKAANLKALASKFIEIDPTMVDDIYEYNRLAKMIEESVAGSSVRGKDVKFANIVQEGDVIPYINKILDAQNKTLFEEKLREVQDILSEIQDILGIDAKDLSYEDLLAILSDTDTKSKGKDNDKLVRDAINKAFDVYSSVIKSIIKTGVDPFSGQEVSYTDSQKKIISDFMDMDLNIIPTPQALEAVDAALNFLQNKSTAKMESIFMGYMGEKNARELVKRGVRASALRKYFSPGLARFFGEQTTNLGLLFERLFKGFEAGGLVQDMMGLTDLIKGKSQAQNESNRIINDYVGEFYKKKANGEAFNTELNNVERGMAAFLMRNVIGTEAEIKAEFKRRKDLISGIDKNGKRIGSIVELENGNEKEQAKAKVYQEVYDKILKDAKTIDDVTSKVDAVNLEAVKFWQDQWQNKYDELSDVSLNVYNKVLEKDINYTPDKYGRLSSNTEDVDITEKDMAFNVNNGTLYEKETGVLIKATRPDPLPVDRFIDLSFDSNNANSMYDALVDIKTAGPIRQVKAFLNSKSFKKIFPKAEDAVILKGSKKDNRIGRIELFTKNFRNKNPYSEDEFSSAVRNLNRLANVGVSQALGGIFQPVKQVIPAAMNTLINGGSLDFNAMTNPDKIKFMMDSGYAIGFRGVESQAQVDSLNKLMDMAAKSRGEKAMKYIEEANKIWLKVFLVKPDVFIARASWMTYYEQSLAKQGIDAKGIDYKTHKLNEKAANYAQRMLDRQQNVSDADLSGKLFSEKNPGKQVMMKVFMPFASFRMNQSARIGSDIATITSKVSTEEDRKIAARSLAGFGVEMITFRALSLGISVLTASLVAKMMGSDEEDEEKKKNSIIKGQATNTISDVLSPIPFTDPIIQAVAATTLQAAQDVAGVEEEDMVSIYSPQDKGYLEQIGLFGFAAQRAVQTGELVWMSSVGSYRDSYGKKKYVSDDDKEALRLLIGPAILTNLGLAPSEINSVIRASMSAAKKNSSTKEGGSTSGKDYESKMLDIMEEDLLEGYENKAELKRYNPRLYEQNFGERSEYYQLTKEKRAEEKKAADEKQKEKDTEYGYKGDGKGFGSRSKNSGKGFGAKKFGKD